MPTLNWIGKEAVAGHHLQVPFHLLKDVPDLSCGRPGEGNLLVQGDNLVALKALLPYYAGQVKCIYIDPPYNTGNEGWAYNDNVNSPVIRDWLGKVVGKEGETLDRHDRWLCMMYPRLALLRQFLTVDGAIFISIDDNEVQYLRSVMDEIFGANNFVAQCTWQKAYSPRMDAKTISWDHDYILIYGRTEIIQIKRLSFTQNTAQFNHVDPTSGRNYRRRQWRKEGSGAKREDRPNLYYPIKAPDAQIILPIRPDGTEGRWRGNLEYFISLTSKGEIEWVKHQQNWQIYVKQFSDKASTKPPSTWWPSEEVGHNHEAAEEIRETIGAQKFPTPKPTRLLRHILEIAADKNSLILDSFAGSGTTGHAVMAQNKADGGNRRFILVEIDEKICRDVTAQRLTRVVEGYGDVPGLGGGFRYCTLGETLFDEGGKIRESVRFAELARHVYFTETGEPLPRERVANTPFLGEHHGLGIYLLFNGILKDKSAGGGNILTRGTLAQLSPFDGPKVIYCAGCLLGQARLARERITVRQTPYEIKVS